MRSRTLANEKTRDFYTQLKRPYLFSWYVPELGDRRSRWIRLSTQQKQSQFKIDQIAFFQKHFWYHFIQSDVNGWIPVEHFRKNYCRLSSSMYSCSKNVNSELACIIMLCMYVRPQINVNKIIDQYNSKQPQHVKDLFSIVAKQLGTFKNLSRKSMRRIRNQIRHQCPVIMKVRIKSRVHDIIVTGFKRRLFLYGSPWTGHYQVITRKPLLKAWERCGYQAFSC